MNSNDIRSQISAALENEEQTKSAANRLTERLKNSGLSMTPAQQEDTLNFVKAYISETPDLMDAAFHAADQAGKLSELQPIFDTSFNYWAEQQDYIPDTLGLIGLTDDAYLTRMFMESISSLHAAQTWGQQTA
jgi:uncharacterized membrane protein YkvA (DUF1232 family)